MISNRKEIEVDDHDREHGETISNVVNRGGSSPAVAYYLAHYIHRTLQQNLMRLIMSYIEFQAAKNPDRESDFRNEATVKTCKRLQELIDEERKKSPAFGLLPYI
jgi:hypothetical protein